MADPVTASLLLGASAVEGLGGLAQSKHEAAQLRTRAKVARTRADQISTQHLSDLNQTIDNIRAIRASTGASPDSPSSLAVIRRNIEISERNRSIETGNARIEAAQADADAVFKRKMGYIQLGTSLLKGGARALSV